MCHNHWERYLYIVLAGLCKFNTESGARFKSHANVKSGNSGLETNAAREKLRVSFWTKYVDLLALVCVDTRLACKRLFFTTISGKISATDTPPQDEGHSSVMNMEGFRIRGMTPEVVTRILRYLDVRNLLQCQTVRHPYLF